MDMKLENKAIHISETDINSIWNCTVLRIISYFAVYFKRPDKIEIVSLSDESIMGSVTNNIVRLRSTKKETKLNSIFILNGKWNWQLRWKNMTILYYYSSSFTNGCNFSTILDDFVNISQNKSSVFKRHFML